ncbi:MAG: putative flippase GtrA [Lysobacterales bacterium]|jgi:putative flippase GtrA
MEHYVVNNVIDKSVNKIPSQLLRYAAIGVSATAVHYLIMAVLVNSGWFPVFASTVGAVAGAIVAYIANRRWTFSVNHTTSRMLRFMSVALLGLVMNAVLLMIFQIWFIESIIGAQLLTTLIVFVVTFFINLVWSFA